jgi:hypothetical protein
MAAARQLKGSRRELAAVFGEDWKTAHEVGVALGRPTGSIFGVLSRMHRDGLLISDCEPEPPTRGTQYHLSPHAIELLGAEPYDEEGVGQLKRGQRLLVVEHRKGRRRASRILAEGSSAGVIAWGAETPSGWLLVMASDVDPFRVQELSSDFEAAGCRCVEAPVDAVVAGSLLRGRAQSRMERSSGIAR